MFVDCDLRHSIECEQWLLGTYCVSSFCCSCPCLVILEDLHDLCPFRDTPLSESERRAIACLSAQMDDLHRCPPPRHVTVLATTNQVDRVEPRLRQPGRFEKEVEVPIPSSNERLDVCASGWGGEVEGEGHFISCK